MRLIVGGALIPASAKTFDVSKLELTNSIRLASGQNPITPTVAGAKTEGPLMEILDDDGTTVIENFNLPKGANLPLVPAGMLQATVGLPRGLDITARAIPEIKLGSDSVR